MCFCSTGCAASVSAALILAFLHLTVSLLLFLWIFNFFVAAYFMCVSAVPCQQREVYM